MRRDQTDAQTTGGVCSIWATLGSADQEAASPGVPGVASSTSFPSQCPQAVGIGTLANGPGPHVL